MPYYWCLKYLIMEFNPSILFISRIKFGSPDFDLVADLRQRVLRTPLGLSFLPDQFAEEWSQWHFAAYSYNYELMGCLTLVPVNSDIIKMRQVAIEPSLQGHGIGSALIKYSEFVARNAVYTSLFLHARDTAVPFYQKLGYHIEGDLFEEVGIPHYAMRKEIA